MALIKCPECGNQVSDKATACPNCGCPIGSIGTAQEQMYEDESPKKKWWIWPLVVTLLCLISGGGYYYLSRNSHSVVEINTEKKDSINSNNAIVEFTPEFVEALDVYDELSSFSEGYAAVRRGKKWGYINTKGEEVIQCSYDYADRFSEGLAAVCKKDKYGFIDATGNTIIPFTYDFMPHPFSEGLAAVFKEVNKWEWIDKNGEVAVTIEAEDVGNFSEGLAFVYHEGFGDDSKFSFIDKNGKVVFSGKMNGEFYHSGYKGSLESNDFPSFHDGVVYVPTTNSSADVFAKHDRQGKKLQTTTLDQLPYMQKYYSEDYSMLGVKQGNNIIIPAKYNLIGGDFGNLIQSSNGVILVGLYEYGDEEEPIVHYGYADLKGNDTFSEGLKEELKSSAKLKEELEEDIYVNNQDCEENDNSSTYNTEKTVTIYVKGTFAPQGGHITCESNYSTRQNNLSRLIIGPIVVPNGKVWIYKDHSFSSDSNIRYKAGFCDDSGWRYILANSENDHYGQGWRDISDMNGERYFGGKNLYMFWNHLNATPGGQSFYFEANFLEKNDI